ncbi:MAG: DUF86 domain-containing protein [Candidatus Competibacter sp.]|nr:DUF86 domain-containing protein [Candidatus Competibacter sp.]
MRRWGQLTTRRRRRPTLFISCHRSACICTISPFAKASVISSEKRGIEYDSFVKDTKTQDAVIRNLEILGEATKNLSEEFRAAHAGVPWKGMEGNIRDVGVGNDCNQNGCSLYRGYPMPSLTILRIFPTSF